MNKVFLLIAFSILSYGTAFADIECGSTISSGGSYTLDAAKTCSGTWVTINADNVSIDGRGHPVTYGSTSAAHGIVIQDGNENATIYSLVLTQGANGLNAISATNADIGGLELNAVAFNLNTTPDTSCLYATYGTADRLNIHDSIFNVNATGQAWGIFLSGDADGAVGGNIAGNTFNLGAGVNSGRPAAVRLTGYSGSEASRPVFSDNTVTILGAATYGWVGWATDYWIVANNTITLGSSADNSKGVQVDGGSSHNEIYGNTIVINSTDNESASYGVRVRFASANNTIRDNEIDISGSSGLYGALGVAIGADQLTEPTAPPSNIFVYGNTILGSGSNIPVQIYEDLDESYFYCNTLTNPSGYTVTTYSGGVIDTVEFSGNTHISDGDAVRIVGSYTISDLSFCNETVNGAAMLSADVTDSADIGGWAVAASGCLYGCEGDPEDPETPTTSGPILRTGSSLLRVGDGVLRVQ